jgi:hypothetical protein
MIITPIRSTHNETARRPSRHVSTSDSFVSPRNDVPILFTTLRLYVLRAAYFLIFIFLTTQILPQVISRGPQYPHMSGVARALLAALGLLALLGVRYPVKMLPIMLFELAWKTIWVLAIGLPLRMAGQLDAAKAQTLVDCSVGVVICLVVIPWPYVIDTYFRSSGDRWRRAEAPPETCMTAK